MDGTKLTESLEEKLESVMIRALCRRGKFIYDRSLGSEYEKTMSAREAQFIINEALADCENTSVEVLESGGGRLKLLIHTDSVSAQREAEIYG